MSDTVIIEKKNDITWITIDNPDNGNKVNDAMNLELIGAMDGAADDSRLIVLQSTGPDFSMGRDGGGKPPHVVAPEAYDMRDFFDTVFNFYDAFRRTPLPVIGKVQGRASGFGCAMAALCDITIGADTSSYNVPETEHRIMPTMVMSALIDRLPRKAITYMTYTTDYIDAQHALSIGLISAIAPEGELDTALDATIEKVARIPDPALRAVKEFATNGIGLPMPQAETYARSLHAMVNSSSKMRK